MPTSEPRLTALDQPSREQLDELDALMQRMLALPVDPVDNSPKPPITTAGSQENPPLEITKDKEIGSPAVSVSPASLEHSARSVTLAPVAARPVLPAPGKGGACSSPYVPSTKVRNAGWLWPLVWINQGFDCCTVLLGPLGGWLRGPTGRSLLAWLGFLGLTVALAWLAWETVDWTS
jgi:hypothetical protein